MLASIVGPAAPSDRPTSSDGPTSSDPDLLGVNVTNILVSFTPTGRRATLAAIVG